MDIDGAGQHWPLKFRELVYTVETGEAEMISVDFVARGGGNATAIDSTKATAAAPKVAAEIAEESKKGKGKAKDAAAAAKEGAIDESAVLTAEDEERECGPLRPFTYQTHPLNPPVHPSVHPSVHPTFHIQT